MSRFILIANKEGYPNRPAFERPNLYETSDMTNISETIAQTSIDPNNPKIPQFVNYVLAGQDLSIFLSDDGKFYMQATPVYKKVAELPPEVTSNQVSSIVFTRSQTITGSTQDFMLFLAGQTIYFASSAKGAYSFGQWKQVTSVTTPCFRRPYTITALVDLETRIGAVGRFMDEKDEYYGIIRPRLEDMEIWDIWTNSKFSSVPNWGSASYCTGFYTALDGDYHMYGKIFNNFGTNLLSANITVTNADFSRDVIMPVQRYSRIVSMGETKTGRIAIAIDDAQTLTNFACNTGNDIVQKGVRRNLITWDFTKEVWTNLGAIADSSGLNAVSDFKLLTSTIGYSYGEYCFVLATKCNDQTNALHSLMFKVDNQGKITSFVTKRLDIAGATPLIVGALRVVTGTGYPIINFNVSRPLTTASENDETKKADPASALKKTLANKGIWIMGGISLVFLGIYIYSRIVANVGKTQRQIAAIAKAYERQATMVAQAPPAPIPSAPAPAPPS